MGRSTVHGIGAQRHPEQIVDRTPAVVALWVLLAANVAWSPLGFASYQPAKWLVACAGLLVVALLLTMERQGAVELPVLPLAAALGVLATVVVAWLANEHRLIGVVGWVPRAMGVQAWTLLVALFVAGLVVGGRISLDTFARVLSVVSMAIAATGLLQLIGVNVVQGRGISASRLTTVFGSASNTGAWAAMVIPVLIDRLLRAGRRSSVPEGVAAVLSLVVLVGSGSRAAWLGGSLAVGFVLLRHRVRPDGRAALVAVAGALAVLAVLLAVGRLRRRIVNIPDAASGRWSLWSAGWRAFVDHPWLGAGPESGRVVIPARLQRDFEARFGDLTIEDRAHNVLLDHLVVAGVIGGVALAFLVFVVVRSARRSASIVGSAGMYGLLVAYAVHLLFNFVATEPDALAWLAAGMVCAPAGHRRVVRLARPGAAAVGAAFALVGLVGAVVSTRSLVADAWVRAGIERERAHSRDAARNTAPADVADETGDARDAYRTAASWVSEQPVYWVELAEYAAVIGDFGLSIDAAQRAVRAGAGDPSTREALASALVAAYFATGSTEALDRAVGELSSLAAEDTRNASVRVLLGTALAARGELESALQELRLGTELNPSDGPAWRKRAVVEDALERCTDAAASWAQAERLGERRPEAGQPRCR